MGEPASKTQEKFSYADYLSWNDQKRREIIDGQVYDMTPAPSRYHQEIVRELSLIIGNFLSDKPSDVFFAPFDVRFPEKSQNNEDIFHVVQPDLVVVCNKEKLDDKGCLGAPDIVIEILSPFTSAKDIKTKFDLYERMVVKEYWLIYPGEKVAMVYKQTNKGYCQPKMYSVEDKISTNLLKGLEVDLKQVFEHEKGETSP